MERKEETGREIKLAAHTQKKKTERKDNNKIQAAKTKEWIFVKSKNVNS